MRRRVWVRAAGCGAAVLLLAAACSSGGGGDESSESGQTVSAAEWASATCTSLGDWVDGIEESVANLTPTTDLDEAKQVLQGFLDDAVDRTEALVAEAQANKKKKGGA